MEISKKEYLILIDLQKIDLKIKASKEILEKIPEELNQRKEEFEPRYKRFQEKKESLKRKEAEHHNLQGRRRGTNQVHRLG